MDEELVDITSEEKAHQDEVWADIQAMETLTDTGPAEAVEEEPVVAAEPVEPVEPAEPVVEEAKVTVEQPAVVETKSEPVAPLSEIDEFRKQQELLVKQIEELHQQLAKTKAVDQPVEPITTKPIEPPTDSKPFQFITDEEYQKGLNTAEEFNKLLTKVAATATEMAIRAIPEVVVRHTNNHVAMIEMHKRFYDANPDLAHVKQTVAAVANQVHAETPQLSTDKVLAEAAKRTRSMLGLAKQAEVRTSQQPTKPAFAQQRGGSRIGPPKKELSRMAAEVADLINIQ